MDKLSTSGPRKDTEILLQRINFAGMVSLFLWVSFFAAIISEKSAQGRFIFIFILFILLLVSLVLGKNYYKSIINKTELPFYIFLLTMLGGLIAVKEPPVAYGIFWSFIFPAIPVLFFFGKIGFLDKYGFVLIRSICLMALLVFIFGIIEFTTKQNLIHTGLFNPYYYSVLKGNRMMSLHIHSAPLGTYFVAVLPLAVALIIKEKKVFFKLLAVSYTAFISIGIILTFSRGALLGAFIGMFTMVIILFGHKKRVLISLLALLLIIIIASSSLLFYRGYFPFERYSWINLSTGDSHLRKLLRIIMTGQIFKDHPFFGVGFGHFRVLFDYYLPKSLRFLLFDSKKPDEYVADCMFLTILAETGLVGFTGFCLFVVSLFKRIGVSLKRTMDHENKLLLACFLSGLIGIMCTFLTYDVLYWTAPSYLFWSYAGILASLTTRNNSG
jgi:O-antigen ligase